MTGGLLGINDTWISFNPHTHAGCDQSTPYSLSHYSEFQSTHPRRVWLSNITNISNMEVSIHTPTQGVTRVDDRTSMLLSVSIHTPTQGVTNPAVLWYRVLQFQSTHPRRVWRRNGFLSVRIWDVSIHTPTQGVTGFVVGNFSGIWVSIHTPTQGVTADSGFCCFANRFQSTHPRRVWLYI